MKKKKKIFIISYFYIFGGIISIAAPIVLLVLIICRIGKSNLAVDIFMYIFCPICFVFAFIVCGIGFLQWVEIDEHNITARCIFGIIRQIKWDDVLEVTFVRIGYSPIHPLMGWFMFTDSQGGEVYLKSPFNWKGRCIKIKANKRNQEFLKQCRPDVEFVNYYADFNP